MFVAVVLATLIGYCLVLGFGPTLKEAETAVSKVFILPDRSLPAVAGVIVSPSYLSFTQKLNTLVDDGVLERATSIIADGIEFASPAARLESLQEALRRGRDLVRGRHGGRIDRDRLFDELKASTWSKHPQRQQVVEIHSRAGSELEARLFSCAVAEAASQYHFDRVQRTARQMLEELAPRIDATEVELAGLASALGSVARLNVVARSLFVVQESLDHQEAEREIRSRQNLYRLQSIGSAERNSDGEESAALTKAEELLTQAQLDLGEVRASLSPMHPRLQALSTMVGRLSERRAQLRELDRARSSSTVAAAALQERLGLEVDAAVGEERSREVAEMLNENAVAQGEASFEERKVQVVLERLAEMRVLDRAVRMYLVTQASTVVPYSFAMRAEPVGASGLATKLLLIGLLAVTFGFGVTFTMECFDRRVRSAHDLRGSLALPLLGVLPRDQGQIQGALDSLTTVVQSKLAAHRGSVMVCSALPGEGKSTVATGLALSLARRGRRVLIVDTDRQAPTILEALRLGGVSTTARGQHRDLAHGVSVTLQGTSQPNLSLWSCGASTCSIESLGASRLSGVLRELERDFDYLIFDTAPISLFGGALALGAVVGTTLMVAVAEETTRGQLAEAQRQLELVGAKVIGVVLNRFPEEAARALGRVKDHVSSSRGAPCPHPA